MKSVQVLLFAALRDLTGQDSLEVVIPNDGTVGDLRSSIVKEFPAAGDLVRRSMFAIDERFAKDHEPVPDSGEIACIPPVSGG